MFEKRGNMDASDSVVIEMADAGEESGIVLQHQRSEVRRASDVVSEGSADCEDPLIEPVHQVPNF